MAKEKPASKPKPQGKKKARLAFRKGIFYVNSSYNNTMVTLTDVNGRVASWFSSGRAGFKGPKKSTPFAAGIVVRKFADIVKQAGMTEADIVVKGIGMGRDAAIRAINGLGVQILSIKDKTPVPHNGPRQKKVRRV